ncbi:MAG: DMT family transporter [Flavobacteriales bacterium]|nr:DMT family transporter [Flavobacteriales bacterium]
MNSRSKAHLALLIVALIYSANYIIAKDLMPHYISPRGFIFLRVIGATVLFLILGACVKSKTQIARNDWFRIVLCGLFGVAANQILFFEGLNLTSPISASVIMTLNPVLVLAMGALMLNEKMTRTKILGVFIGGVGAVWLILGSSGDRSSLFSISWGNLFIFLNATSYALYLVLVKPLMSKYQPLQVIRWVFTAGLFISLPFTTKSFIELNWSLWTTQTYVSAVYVVVFTTFLAYLLNVFALKTLTSSTVSIYIYLQPLLTTSLALILGKDELTVGIICAASLIFSGVYLVSKKRKTS